MIVIAISDCDCVYCFSFYFRLHVPLPIKLIDRSLHSFISYFQYQMSNCRTQLQNSNPVFVWLYITLHVFTYSSLRHGSASMMNWSRKPRNWLPRASQKTGCLQKLKHLIIINKIYVGPKHDNVFILRSLDWSNLVHLIHLVEMSVSLATGPGLHFPGIWPG